MKKEKLQAAISAVLAIHSLDTDLDWCQCCEVNYPCPTVQVIALNVKVPITNPCTYTFAHTKHWCGYPMCRES